MNNGLFMFKNLSLPIALATVFASSSSVAHHCPPTYVYVPIAWETIYFYKNECTYFLNTTFVDNEGDTIQATGAAEYDTSWSTNLDNVRCPTTIGGRIDYANISNPGVIILHTFGPLPLYDTNLLTREERGEPTEWEWVAVHPDPHESVCSQ
ncbi:hypothetical protein [Microbulbifer discodermiae]|uniref:hypothetical protein n=1 Tax=Microbulbifer sp. 2201CG32-9 TaxID=3232309 RepID=UPI00345BF3DF